MNLQSHILPFSHIRTYSNALLKHEKNACFTCVLPNSYPALRLVTLLEINTAASPLFYKPLEHDYGFKDSDTISVYSSIN